MLMTMYSVYTTLATNDVHIEWLLILHVLHLHIFCNQHFDICRLFSISIYVSYLAQLMEILPVFQCHSSRRRDILIKSLLQKKKYCNQTHALQEHSTYFQRKKYDNSICSDISCNIVKSIMLPQFMHICMCQCYLKNVFSNFRTKCWHFSLTLLKCTSNMPFAMLQYNAGWCITVFAI